MDGEQDGSTQTQEGREEQQGSQEQPQEGQDAQAHEQEGVGGAGKAATDFERVLKEKDARIVELEGKVAEAAKTQEATKALTDEIAALKQQMADERVELGLKAAGARSVKAAKALLSDFDGDIAALAAAEPWMFGATAGAAKGATGLEPAGASGGSDAAYLKRWEKIAGLDAGEGDGTKE